MGQVSLRTNDLGASIHDAVDVLGLQVTAAERGVTYLAASAVHHELRLIESSENGVESLGLIARDGDAFRELRSRVDAEGLRILRHRPAPLGVADSFAFVGPEGFVFEVMHDIQDRRIDRVGFGPTRYGHFNFHPTQPTAMKEFLVRVFGFRVSDVIGEDYAYFLRCNSEHHGIAIIKGDGTLHHHAWGAQSVSELTRLGDRLHVLGRKLIWGPVRHGAGSNIAAYYVEHTGNVVELYTDIEHIYNDLRAPVYWQESDVWFNDWSDYVPEGFRRLGVRPAEVVDGVA
nr:VOC family protein [Herbiconiux sp. KACC 21604]